MALTLELEGLTASEAIKEYLVTLGEGNPYGFYKLWSQFKKRTSYKAVRQLFWTLEEIGLIEHARWEQGRGFFKKHYYRAVRSRIDDPAWIHPQQELYPSTKLGRRYKPSVKKGLKPRGGRKPKYRK